MVNLSTSWFKNQDLLKVDPEPRVSLCPEETELSLVERVNPGVVLWQKVEPHGLKPVPAHRSTSLSVRRRDFLRRRVKNPMILYSYW